MPHNLFLHSALVLGKDVRPRRAPLRSAYKYKRGGVCLALLVTLVINFAVVIVAARSIRDADFRTPPARGGRASSTGRCRTRRRC